MASRPAATTEPEPTTYDHGGGGPGSSGQESPKEILERLAEQLADSDASNKAAGEDLAAEKADIKAINAAWAQVNEAVTAYEGAQEALEAHSGQLYDFA